MKINKEPAYAILIKPETARGYTDLDWQQANLIANRYSSGMRSATDARAGLHQFCEYLHLVRGVNAITGLKQTDLDAYLTALKTMGNSPSTINTKMSLVSVLLDHAFATLSVNALVGTALHGNRLKVPYVSRPKHNQWWLKQDDKAKLLDWLAGKEYTGLLLPFTGAPLMAKYIRWTVATGLRVEETLRLLPADFDGLESATPALIVPGTKTTGSRVRIPLSNEAAEIAIQLINRFDQPGKVPPTRRLFDVDYRWLKDRWNDCRKFLKVENNPTSTLKALRRNFAAECLLKGIPANLIQELMRHTSLETTMGYLKLIGMTDNQATRDMLNRNGVLSLKQLDANMDAAILAALGVRTEKPTSETHDKFLQPKLMGMTEDDLQAAFVLAFLLKNGR